MIVIKRFITICLIAGFNTVSSFQVSFTADRFQRTTTRQFASTTSDDDSEGTATLMTLSGSMDVSSTNLPLVTNEEFSAFLEDNYYLLVSAGGQRELKELKLTPELVNMWKNACKLSGAEEPNEETDSAVQVRTGGIDFPGLHLVSLAKIGVKKIKDSDSKRLYQFILLGDEQKVSGLPPVVWIFEKLTGSKEKDSKDRQSSSSVTTVSYKDVNDSEIAFSISSQLTIQVNFPKVLLKILPTNKEKAEESGGKSIKKLLEKDVAASMKAFEKAYLEKFSR